MAVIRLPHVANFTDLDPLLIEPGVAVRWVDDARSVGHPDLIVLPGSKATGSDLAWLRRRGLDRALGSCPTTVLGICAGYQMLGSVIEDPGRVESDELSTPGLGLLEARTCFGPEKVTRVRVGQAWGRPVRGYQLHHGRVTASGAPLVIFSDAAGGGDGSEGRTAAGGIVVGTTMHGLLDEDDFRRVFLEAVGRQAGTMPRGHGSFEQARQRRIDDMADAVGAHLDVAALDRLVAAGRLPSQAAGA